MFQYTGALCGCLAEPGVSLPSTTNSIFHYPTSNFLSNLLQPILVITAPCLTHPFQDFKTVQFVIGVLPCKCEARPFQLDVGNDHWSLLGPALILRSCQPLFTRGFGHRHLCRCIRHLTTDATSPHLMGQKQVARTLSRICGPHSPPSSANHSLPPSDHSF